MHKKILAAVLGTILVTGTGCQGKSGEETQSAAFQENTDEAAEAGNEAAETGDGAAEAEAEAETEAGAETEAEAAGQADAEESILSEEMQQEQEAGAAQLEADAIDQLHEQNEIPAESVEQTVFAQSALQLDESAGWIRVCSENREDGSFGEVYSCEDGLEYEWNYYSSDGTEAGGDVETALTQAGWSVSDASRDDTLSDALGHEVYHYLAYEDDNGYSMIHQGLYLDIEGGYYTADFSMMEGNMGIYYDRVETLLSQIYIA